MINTIESKKEGGLVLIDKPYGWTSFDVVKKLRNISRIKKIGHAGTLDPLATGLLIVCYGKYTKRIEEIQHQTKEYTGKFHIGATTPSFDRETEVDALYPTDHISRELIQDKISLFLGEIDQIPPQYSAIKVSGKRAFDYAREGKEVQLKPRKAEIGLFEILSFTLPEISFRLRCSKGTYVRSIARDYGKALQSGAYLSELRRTKIGVYSVEDSLHPESFKTPEDFYLHSIQY